MFIPPEYLKDKFESNSIKGSKVRLKSMHLLIDHDIASEAFGDNMNVFVVYYPDRKTLMLAPTSDEIFKNLHKAAQQMLKSRSSQGDKSIALHEMIIDNQLDGDDRDLEYDLKPGMGILNVKF